MRTPLDLDLDTGHRAPYGETLAICARCKGRVMVRVETDGSGVLLDLVEPCQRCAPRPSSIRVASGFETLECEGCGRAFRREVKRGQKPRLGPCCR